MQEKMKPSFLLLIYKIWFQNFSKTLPATGVSSTQNQAGHHDFTDARLRDRTHSPDREKNMKSVSVLEYNRLVESEKSYKAQVQELTTR